MYYKAPVFQTSFFVRRSLPPRAKLQEPVKNKITNFVKLTGHTYAWNSLTNFENEARAMTGNKNNVNWLNFAWKNS